MTEYVAAVRELDRTVADDGELAASRVLQARLALYRGLQDQGWQPPADVATALELDDVVAHMGLGAVAKVSDRPWATATE